MIRRALRALLRDLVFERGKLPWGIYKRVAGSSHYDYVEYLRRHGGLHSIGRDVLVTEGTEITDPAYTRIGNNVVLSSCALIGHDGSIGMLNRAYGLKLDRVGKIDIKDNVFIGYRAIVMPGVTIGPNAIVAAGAVVVRDVAPGTIVAGVPARKIGDLDETVAKLDAQTRALPWADLIAQRDGDYDPAIEPELVRQRVRQFYGER